MKETILIIAFFIWYFISLVISENLGKKSKLGVDNLFVICLIATPFVGLIIYTITKKQSRNVQNGS